MTVPEATPPATPEPRPCTLCGSRVGAGLDRCGACGTPVAVGPGAPNPFTHRLLWAMAGGVLAIYLVVLALVVALR